MFSSLNLGVDRQKQQIEGIPVCGGLSAGPGLAGRYMRGEELSWLFLVVSAVGVTFSGPVVTLFHRGKAKEEISFGTL